MIKISDSKLKNTQLESIQKTMIKKMFKNYLSHRDSYQPYFRKLFRDDSQLCIYDEYRFMKKLLINELPCLIKDKNYFIKDYIELCKKWDRENAFGKKFKSNDEFQEFNSTICKIFSYSKFFEKKRVEIFSVMNVTTCPYCNLNAIQNLDATSINPPKTTADAEHFLPKSIFPLFSSSFGNLLPSCSICNSRFKGTSTTEIINPRVEEFGSDCKFYYQDLLNLLEKEPDMNSLILKSDESSIKYARIEDSKLLFRLEEVYRETEDIKGVLEEYFAEFCGYTEDYLINQSLNSWDQLFENIKKENSKKRFFEKELGSYTQQKFRIDIISEFIELKKETNIPGAS